MSGAVRSLAIVTPFYPPHVGGVERYSQEFARAALDLGLSVNVVTTDAVRRPDETIEDGGIRVLRLPARNIPVMGSHYPIATVGWKRAEPLLDCDVVLAHTRFFMTTLLSARITARRGKRICVLDHGSGPLRKSPRLLASASLIYERFATAALKRLSARFFAVSAASSDWLGHFGIRNARLIPNGTTPRRQMPLRGPDAFKRPVVFFAGRLLPEKGLQELIDAVGSLCDEGLDITLRIAGEGPLSEFIEARARQSKFLTYLGRISPSDVACELDRASIFVHASRLPEGLPTILLEAGAAALPVISTPYGGSSELIADGETGWLIRTADAAAIAEAIRAVVRQPDEALRRGGALFSVVQRAYVWPTIVTGFLDAAEENAA
jgi:glycosyltransferase involved in cell wall biosynthesis